MNKVQMLAEMATKFSKDDLEVMSMIVEAHNRGVDVSTYNCDSSKWAVRVICSLLPFTVDTSTIVTVLKEWYYDYTIPECYFEEDTNCKMCTHPHCRVLFPVKNRINKHVIHTGSSCVKYFCLTYNLVEELYDLSVVHDNLVDAEAIAREESRLEHIRKTLTLRMRDCPFRTSMLEIHTTGSKYKGKLTPMQASKIVEYLDDSCDIKISLGKKSLKDDALKVFDAIAPYLTVQQRAKINP